jgi:hypothetical protein
MGESRSLEQLRADIEAGFAQRHPATVSMLLSELRDLMLEAKPPREAAARHLWASAWAAFAGDLEGARVSYELALKGVAEM